MTASSLDTVDCPDAAAAPPADCQRLTVVVPCFNEAESLTRLAVELRRLRHALAGQYEAEILLVDDGSTDATWQLLHDHFGDDPATRLIRHETNRGIAAAIRTGLAHASAEIVASIDADCTYQPVQLLSLLALMADDVDMVVASPYHPAGKVVGVAGWRLALSRLASRLYALVLRNQLHTYTSCFRVYRKSSVVDLSLSRGGFVGVVELLWQLDRHGGRIVECPAVLSVRTTGQSKMRVARTAFAHLGLLAHAAWQRLLGRRPSAVIHPNSDSIVKSSSSSRLAPRTT
jgi:glycosyltransferase involved in cell wall biosynthesis